MSIVARPSVRQLVRSKSPRRGVALLVVLWTILVLASVTAVASSAARQSADVARARRAGTVAHSMASSGIVAASLGIERELQRTAADSEARFTFLDGLEPDARTGQTVAADTLDDGVFAVTVIDVSARLDANLAGREGWYTLLRENTDDASARSLGDRIDAQINGTGSGNASAGGNAARSAADVRLNDSLNSRDSLVARLLGREPVRRLQQRIESIDDLLEVPGVTPQLLERIAPLLTVDGNGTVNRRAASPVVLAAAAGSLVDHPARLLLVSRGWMIGHPLTREIEAVYDVADDGLRLVRWRERER